MMTSTLTSTYSNNDGEDDTCAWTEVANVRHLAIGPGETRGFYICLMDGPYHCYAKLVGGGRNNVEVNIDYGQIIDNVEGL
jgi:hypothetical protein